ncbi:hypothetical protein PHYPSEUDO_010881 [Phytophthora pseudosyringae]|uniref:Uncharacterized protein n=1 Tax=Phytophthora pseudosyringae TaxID=221518 RepID=A0A8T1V9A7_9STRA|nr:hypothetical protein PHYPSEUDO_010881 [Phytophthora pseudosyringae]
MNTSVLTMSADLQRWDDDQQPTIGEVHNQTELYDVKYTLHDMRSALHDAKCTLREVKEDIRELRRSRHEQPALGTQSFSMLQPPPVPDYSSSHSLPFGGISLEKQKKAGLSAKYTGIPSL